MERNTFMAKKVFFLHPHSVVQQGMVQELVANEYAVYLVNNHRRFREIVRDFNDPVVFINIDEQLDSDGWKEYVEDLMNSGDNSAGIGVLTYNEDQELAKTYLMDLGIPCGFIKLKLGLEQSRQIILKTLEANEAKGRRKFLRIDCWDLQNIEFNMKINEKLVAGRIRDISSVGIAFMFNEEQVIQLRTVLRDIQLKLRGKIARISGPVIGQRVIAEGTIYVLLFDKNTTPDTKNKIHNFIYETLQEEIKQIMNV